MLWALIILILCGIPGRDIPHISFLELLSVDKFIHAGIFFVLVLLTTRGFMLQTNFMLLQQLAKIGTLIICIIYGGVLELMQEAVFEERSADVYDFIANSVGCLLGTYFYTPFEKRFLVRFIR